MALKKIPLVPKAPSPFKDPVPPCEPFRPEPMQPRTPDLKPRKPGWRSVI